MLRMFYVIVGYFPTTVRSVSGRLERVGQDVSTRAQERHDDIAALRIRGEKRAFVVTRVEIGHRVGTSETLLLVSSL